MSQASVSKSMKKPFVAIGTALLFLAGKLKWLMVVLKVAKFGTLISMFISLGFYAMVYGWKFAVALVYLIYVHEMGHLIAAKRKGIQTSKAIFIPFVGALISMKQEPKHAKDEAYLAFGGPFLGTIAFLPAIPIYMMTHEPFWALVITLGGLINLFNMMPVHPLDGGRIVTVISTKLWIPGIVGMSVYMYFNPNPILALFLLFGITKLWGQIRKDMTFEKTRIVIELGHQTVFELNRISQLSCEEKNNELEQLKKQRAEKEAELAGFKKFYFPFVGDQKMKEKERTDQTIRNLDKIISTIEVDQMKSDGGLEFVEDPFEKMKDAFLNDITRNEQNVEKQKIYYDADVKTKMIWFFAYIGLAAVLIASTMYGNDLMEYHRTLLSK